MMTTMATYSMKEHLRNYMHDIINKNDIEIENLMDEQDIEDLCDYAMSVLKVLADKDTDEERIDFLFEGVMLYSIARRLEGRVEEILDD